MRAQVSEKKCKTHLLLILVIKNVIWLMKLSKSLNQSELKQKWSLETIKLNKSKDLFVKKIPVGFFVIIYNNIDVTGAGGQGKRMAIL